MVLSSNSGRLHASLAGRGNEQVGGAIYWLCGCEAADRQPQCSSADLRRHPHCAQHRRDADLAFMARRTCRSRDSRYFFQQFGADVADEVSIKRIRQTLLRMTVEDDAFAKSGLQALPQTITQFAQLACCFRQSLACDGTGGTQA